MRKSVGIVAILALFTAWLVGSNASVSADTTTVVDRAHMQGWSFQGPGEDHSGTPAPSETGTLVSGPGTPLAGTGSAHFVLGNQNSGEFLATTQFAGTALSSLTTLSFATYTATSGKSVALEFDVDYDPNAACNTLTGSASCYQGRFVFVPAFNNAPQTVATGVWQTWATLDANAKDWYASRSVPGHSSLCTQAAPCSMADLLGVYPNASIISATRLGAPGQFGVKAGSGYSSFDGNTDNIVVGTSAGKKTFDFELGSGAATFYVRSYTLANPQAPDPDVLCNGQTDADFSAATTPDCAFRTIQHALDTAVTGDTVNVDNGTYNESPNITKSVTLQSVHGQGNTTITLQTGPTYLGSLAISASNVTVDGFTIKGRDGSNSALAASNIYLTAGLNNVTIKNNKIQVGNTGGASNGDDGIGVLTTYTTDPASLSDNVSVTGNTFTPLGSTGFRAFYVNPGVNVFTFQNNQITGSFAATSLTQAKNATIGGNTVTGAGGAGNRSAGIGAWGFPDPSIWGHANFTNNQISGTRRGITLYTAQGDTISQNTFDQNDTAVWIGLADGGDAQPNAATISLDHNTFNATNTKAIDNTLTGTVSGTPDWFGSATGPTNATNVGGAGAAVSGPVTFSPWCGNQACSVL